MSKQYANKKIIIFDLDGTLAKSKMPIEPDMADLLTRLLIVKKVSVISGGKLDQMKTQFLSGFSTDAYLHNLFLQPTSGAALYEWQDGKWKEIYKEMLSENDREKINETFKVVLTEFFAENPEAKPPDIFGQQIEDREEQVTFSALGQEAPLEFKEKWDPDQERRKSIVKKLEVLAPEFSFNIGGSNSIDVTKKGIDKAYGIRQLALYHNTLIENMLYVGDALFPGGNDWAAKTTDIDCFEVEGPEQTKKLVEDLLSKS